MLSNRIKHHLTTTISPNKHTYKVEAKGLSITSEEDFMSIYEIFRESYIAETGTAWSYEKFRSRASNWEFYPTNNPQLDGFISVRRQRSGLVKLVGAAGNPKTVVKGFIELSKENNPAWGLMDRKLVNHIAKLPGWVTPSAKVINIVSKIIPPSVFGDAEFIINEDGGFEFIYSDIGKTKPKYLIANKKYYMSLIPMITVNATLSMKEKAKLLGEIKNLIL